MKLKLFSVALIVLLSAFFGLAQATNLLETTNLNFSLNGEPTPQDVGFDNPKSSWKVKYELYLTDFSELEKLGICHRDEANRHICERTYDKKFDKPVKKISLKISKGNFAKKLLSDEKNREVVIPINLPPNIIEIFNQATKLPERNPTFVLFITQKISVKNSANAKLKEKFSNRGIKQLKTADSNRTFEYWDVKNLSIIVTIAKRDNGQITLVGSLIH